MVNFISIVGYIIYIMCLMVNKYEHDRLQCEHEMKYMYSWEENQQCYKGIDNCKRWMKKIMREKV